MLERRDGNLEYQIKWEGSRTLTWEPADNSHNEQAVNSKFKVEAIVRERQAGCEFLVNWKRYAKLEWGPKKNLGGTNCLLQKFDDARFYFILVNMKKCCFLKKIIIKKQQLFMKVEMKVTLPPLANRQLS